MSTLSPTIAPPVSSHSPVSVVPSGKRSVMVSPSLLLSQANVWPGVGTVPVAVMPLGQFIKRSDSVFSPPHEYAVATIVFLTGAALVATGRSILTLASPSP